MTTCDNKIMWYDVILVDLLYLFQNFNLAEGEVIFAGKCDVRHKSEVTVDRYYVEE